MGLVRCLLLKEVYRNNFYLIGLLRTETERKRNLTEAGMSEIDASTLILRDKKSTEKFGQQVEDTIFKSDYFIKNIDSTSRIKKSVVWTSQISLDT